VLLYVTNKCLFSAFRCYYCEDCLKEHGGALIECSEVYSVPTSGDIKRGDAKLACEKFGRRKGCVIVDENFAEGCSNPYENDMHPWLGNQSGLRAKEGSLEPATCYCTKTGCNTASDTTIISYYFLACSAFSAFTLFLINMCTA